MAICGRNHIAILVTQLAMGVLISLLLFQLTLMETKNSAISVLVALLYSAGLNFLYFERCIMTETFITFLIVLSVYYFRQLIYGRNYQYIRYLLIFTIMTTPAMVRPMMAYLPLLSVVYLNLIESAGWFFRLKMTALCLIPFLTICMGLCTFNMYMADNFSMQSSMGYSLTNHTGAFIEDAPPEYSAIVNAYLDYRKIQIAGSGSHSSTIFHVHPKLQEELGLSYVELGNLLTKMSITLIRTHPVQYARSVFHAWLNFWKAPVLFSGTGTPILIGRCQRIVYMPMNGLFLILSLLVLIRIRTMWFKARFEIFLIGMVLTGSIIQAVFEYGTNARYAVPFQPIICYVDAVLVWKRGIIDIKAFADNLRGT
jgi:hypothetical protein